MNGMSKAEAMRAAQEARDAVVSRPGSSSSSAREAALKRYLSAEQYHEVAEARLPEDQDDMDQA
jgi:hypothetical protein